MRNRDAPTRDFGALSRKQQAKVLVATFAKERVRRVGCAVQDSTSRAAVGDARKTANRAVTDRLLFVVPDIDFALFSPRSFRFLPFTSFDNSSTLLQDFPPAPLPASPFSNRPTRTHGLHHLFPPRRRASRHLLRRLHLGLPQLRLRWSVLPVRLRRNRQSRPLVRRNRNSLWMPFRELPSPSRALPLRPYALPPPQTAQEANLDAFFCVPEKQC